MRFCGACGTELAPRGGTASGAQDGHDRLLRRDRLDRPRRAARPRGAAAHDGPLLRGDQGRRGASRRSRGEVHRRRRDGRLRHPDRARGRRRARSPGGRRDTRAAAGARRGARRLPLLPHRREHRRGGRGRGRDARHGRRRQRRRPVRAGGGCRRDPDRRRDLPARPERRHGRGGRAARAEGEGASPCPPTGSWPWTRSRRAPPATSTCPSSGGCASRAGCSTTSRTSSRAGRATCSRCSGRPAWASRGSSQQFLSDVGRTSRGLAQPLPPLRRRHHVLAARRDADPDGRRAGRGHRRVTGGDAARVPAAPRGARRASAADPAPRRPALGRGRCSSTSSSTSPTGRATPRSCCSASPGPELLEARPGWGGGKLNATTILLEPLSAEDSDELIARLAAGARRSRRTRATASSPRPAGNPLYIEEMLAMASENGQDGALVIPPTIQALLQARLDRLSAGEREVVGCGAVEGQVFHGTAVEMLADDPMRPAIPGNLLSLVRKELIRPERSTRRQDEAFRFRHLLIRDAAYDSLPKETRAELHERFAELARGSRRARRAGRDRRLPPRAGAPQPHRAGPVRPASRRARPVGPRRICIRPPARRPRAAIITAARGLLERSVGSLPEARPATTRRPDRSRRSAVPGRPDRGRARRCRGAR